MKRTFLLLLLTLVLALPCAARAEDMPVIDWETPEPTPTPSPSPTPTPTPAPSVPWREIDWANDGAAHYFIILSDARVGDADARTLMLWLEDTYGIPSMAYSVDAATLDVRLQQLTANDDGVAGVFIYGFDATSDALGAVEYCYAQNLPLWVSACIEGDDMIRELDSELEGAYSKKG